MYKEVAADGQDLGWHPRTFFVVTTSDWKKDGLSIVYSDDTRRSDDGESPMKMEMDRFFFKASG